ncbi:MAG TPA: hypothetical protein VER14_08645, partial [Phototrophicaceae bacterium]|nr:hypothetical protein [Phototrophicaceae bacterium]
LMMIVTRDPKTMIQNKCQEEYISQPKHERQKKVNDFCYCILPKSQGEKLGNDFYKPMISLFSAFGYLLS